MLAWASGVAEVPAEQAGVLSTMVEEPAISTAAVPTPADEAIAGTATEVLRRTGTGGAISSGMRSLQSCGRSATGWHAADSARGVDGQVSISVDVTAWRAGAAVAAYRSIRDSVSECADVSERAGHDEFTAKVTGETGAGRLVGAVRLGDTLTLAQVASIGPDSQQVVERVVSEARRLLTDRLRGRCGSIASGRDPGQTGRDPYGGHYSGHLIESKIILGTLDARKASEESLIKADTGEPTWRPPAARPVTELAPLDLESIARAGDQGRPANPNQLVDGFGRPLPRREAPELIDVSTLIGPTDPRPDREVGAAPEPPERPGGWSVTEVPVPDPDGPGCGWDFTGVRAPVVDVTELTVAGRQAQIDRLASDAKRQSDWLVATVAWPRQYAEWVVRRRAAANWEEFERVKAEAIRERERAERLYEATVERWRTGDLPKVPTPGSPPNGAAPEPTPGVSTPTSGPPEE